LFLPRGRGAGFVVTAFPAVEFMFRVEGKVGEMEREEFKTAGITELVGKLGGVRVYAIGRRRPRRDVWIRDTCSGQGLGM